MSVSHVHVTLSKMASGCLANLQLYALVVLRLIQNFHGKNDSECLCMSTYTQFGFFVMGHQKKGARDESIGSCETLAWFR